VQEKDLMENLQRIAMRKEEVIAYERCSAGRHCAMVGERGGRC
jgi:hypothetical protein